MARNYRKAIDSYVKELKTANSRGAYAIALSLKELPVEITDAGFYVKFSEALSLLWRIYYRMPDKSKIKSKLFEILDNDLSHLR